MTTKQFIWKPFFIKELFNKFQTGKIDNVSSFTVIEDNGIEYIGATNRNNGCLYFIEKKESNKFITKGNCIGFIKDGDGSAGYAIYKYENFFSTINVIYGYANWLDRDTGLYFVTCQDKIKNKYSHAYKRNIKHLNGDKVMLPSNGATPNYGFMKNSAFNKQIELINRYKSFAEKQIEQIEYKVITPLSDTNWASFLLTDIFKYQKGDQKNMNKLSSGDIPLVSAKKFNNGYKGFVKSTNILFNGNSITLNNDGDGGAGLAFYQPHDYYLDTHVTSLYSIKQLSKYALLFITKCISIQNAKFGNANPINSKRIKLFKIMLPINAKGEPDYEYMEQYMKNLMIRKYNQYFDYIKSLPYGERI